MRFGVLGPLEVWTAEGRVVRVPEVKVRTLLADLLAHHGHVVPSGRLIEDLWGGSTFTARPAASLQAKVSQLRRALEDAEPGARDLVAHRSPGYVLDVPADALDVGVFRSLVAEARATADAGARARLFTEALALWRGAAFADFAEQPFVRATAAGMEEERLTAVEEHAEARLELGEHSLLIGELTELVDRFPLREGLRAAQMRALYRAGRPAEALDSYRELRRRLDEELGLTPGPALDALQGAILRHGPEVAPPESRRRTPPASGTRRRTNLPAPVNALVGRDEAVADVRALLADRRLVTLTGPGGVGKTRLATAVAGESADAFPDGAWLVELAGVRDSAERMASQELLAEQVMAVLGVRDATFDGRSGGSAQRLADALACRRLLLVLDNCEHVTDAVAGLASWLLSGAAGLRILTTSQVPLRVSGETVWPVPPLTAPSPDEKGLDALRESSAVRLFAERARSADPGFVLDAATAPKVADLCRRLDGIPLALELAATRVRALGVDELHDRLDDRFRLLTSGYRDAPRRHRTLRATLDWSWSLLGVREQTVLRRLAVFADGCGLEAAERVCAGLGADGTRGPGGTRAPDSPGAGASGGAADDVLEVMASLVERSLALRVDTPGGPRYRLPESVAAYAARKLRDAGESADVAARHMRYCAELAERARPLLYGREQRRWLRRLDSESADFQRALEEAHRTGAADVALRLANALTWYRFLRGRLYEGRRALATALDTAGDAAPEARAEARTWQAGLALLLGGHGRDADVAPPREPAGAERTVERARADWFLAFAQWNVGALSAGERRVRRAMDDFRVRRDAWGTAAALGTRVALALARGDLDGLHDDALEVRARFAALGESWGQLQAIEVLSVLAEINGDYEEAARLHREGLRIAESLELWAAVSRKLSGLGRIALLDGRYGEAEDFHGRALRLAAEQGNRPAEQFAALGLALGARREGRLDTARELLRPWLAWNRSRHDAPGLALVLAELGFIAEQYGDAAQALALHQEGLAAARTTEDPRSVALALEGLAGARSLAGDAAPAARLLGAAAAARRAAGAPQPTAEQGDVERIAARVRQALGDETFGREFARGAAEGFADGFARGSAGASAAEHGPGSARTGVDDLCVHPR
ncbi:BTAD domain-containing putative transcriptional regulator [Streptomyces sp. NPDC047928]|uniref:BTAD domain-containing putative transcriptional regulator n=1 Tax=unclassified Streptomyces TaxID=2593676 RepID=UPI00371A22D6